MNNENEFLDWNGSFIATESEFKLFEEGDYPFTVKGFERKIYDGQSKIPNGTHYAEIEFEFMNPKMAMEAYTVFCKYWPVTSNRAKLYA